MNRALGTFVFLSLSTLLAGQATLVAGLPPDWDAGVILSEMGDHAARLIPTLDKINVQDWVSQGASETYVAQLQSAKDQAKAMAAAAKTLARTPGQLSGCLELFFRMQGLEQMIDSLVAATRKYQSAEMAAQLAAQTAENGMNRNRFQIYLVALAAQREQECAVMDREAQRCRSIVATQPPPRSTSGRKK